MRIGKKIKEVTEEPRPMRAPMPRREPEREPAPVRREPVKVGSALQGVGFSVEEIPYGCPHCGRELTMEDGALICPEHGVVYYGN